MSSIRKKPVVASNHSAGSNSINSNNNNSGISLLELDDMIAMDDAYSTSQHRIHNAGNANNNGKKKKKKANNSNNNSKPVLLPPMTDFANNFNQNVNSNLDTSQHIPSYLKPLSSTSLPSRGGFLSAANTNTNSAGGLTGSEAEFLSRQNTAATFNSSNNGNGVQMSQDDDTLSSANTNTSNTNNSNNNVHYINNIAHNMVAMPSPSRSSSASALLQKNTLLNSKLHHHNNHNNLINNSTSNSNNINANINNVLDSNIESNYNSSKSLVAANLKLKTLLEKYQTLSEENHLLTQNVQKRDLELEKMEKKLKKMLLENEKIRQEAVAEHARLVQEHAMEVLQLKEQFAQEKAHLLLQPPPNSTSDSNVSVNNNVNYSTHNSGNTNESANHNLTINNLRAEIEKLRTTTHILQDQLFTQKRQMHSESSQQLLALQQQHNNEIFSMQAQVSALEDKITAINDDKSQLQSKIHATLQEKSVIEQKCRALEQKSISVTQELQLMTQQVQTAYRLDSHSTNTISSNNSISNASHSVVPVANNTQLPSDLETQNRLQHAHYEAKNAQLTHKLAFFKQQYETEKQTLLEAQQEIQSLQRKMSKLHLDFEKKLAKNNEELAFSFKQREQSVVQDYEARMSELTQLQVALQTHASEKQAWLSDKVLLESQVQSYSRQIQQLQRAAEEDRTRLQNLQSRLLLLENGQSDPDSGLSDQNNNHDNEDGTGNGNILKKAGLSRLQSEALIRRLENERAYLKNQLTTELTLKHEVSKVLEDCQRQLSETNVQWSQDVQCLQEKNQQLETQISQMTQNFTVKEERLVTDTGFLNNTVSELKTLTQKLRDQTKMDALQLQQSQTQIRTLQTQLTFVKEEKQHFETLLQDKIQFYEENLKSQNLRFTGELSQINLELTRCKEELSKQLLENSSLQATCLKHGDHVHMLTQQHQRRAHMQRFVTLLFNTVQHRKRKALQTWLQQHQLALLAEQFRDKMNVILQTVSKDTKTLTAQLTSQLQQQFSVRLSDELNQQQSHLAEEHDRRTALLLDEHKQQLTELLETETAKYQQLEADHAYDNQQKQRQMQQLLEQHRQEKDNMLQSHQQELSLALQLQTDTLSATFSQEKALLQHSFEQQLAEKQAKHEALLVAAKESLTSHWQNEVTTSLLRQEKQHSHYVNTLQTHYNEEMRRVTDTHLQEIQQLTQAFEEKAQETQKNQTALFKTQLTQSLEQQRSELYIEFEERVRRLRQAWHEEIFVVEQQKLEEQFQQKTAQLLLDTQRSMQEKEKQLQHKYQQEFSDKETAFLAQQQLFLQEETLRITQTAQKDLETERQRFQETFHLQKIALQEEQNLKLAEQDQQFEKMKESFLEAETLLLREEMQRYAVAKEAELRQLLHEEHQKELQQLTDTHTSAYGQLQRQSDTLKSDIITKTNFFATERNQLLSQIQQFDSKLQALENLKRSELALLTSEHRQTLELLQIKREESEKALLAEFALEKERLSAAVSQAVTDRLTEHYEAQLRQLQTEQEERLKHWQSENTVLMTALEKSLHELKEEKLLLSDKVSQLSAQLEEQTDAFYDLETSHNKLKTRAAYQQWSNLLAAFRQRQRHQKQLQTQTDEFQERLGQEIQRASYPVAERTHSLYLCACYLYQWEKQRKQLLENMSTFKRSELKGIKKEIVLLEQEMTMVNNEKEHFEQVALQLTEEISLLTQQVSEQELLMKQLTNESAIAVNGRINVAFARKKRRIDQEIETLLEQIESKKVLLAQTDARVLDQTQLREVKESVMIDKERALVAILIEQQRFVQQCLEKHMAVFYEKLHFHLSVLQVFPWPPANINNNNNNADGSGNVAVYEASFEEVQKLMAQQQVLRQQQLQLQQQQQAVPYNTNTNNANSNGKK